MKEKMESVLTFLRDLRDVALVIAVLAVPVGGLAKWAIAQEVKKQNEPLTDYMEQSIQNDRDLTLISEWSACMQYASSYAEGNERKRRCDRERVYRRDVWQWEDCKREYGELNSKCVKPTPEISPDTRKQ